MSQEIVPTSEQTKLAPQVLESLVLNGDISKLRPQEKVAYYNHVCEKLGLNPSTQPFGYLRLQGKETLYAKKDAAEQLRKIHGVSIYKLEKEIQGDLYVVTAYARDKDGKEDSDVGAATILNKKNDDLVNAMLKAVTKAKRRVTLSICGLGFLDETEVESIRDAKTVEPDAPLLAPPSQDIIQDTKKELQTRITDPYAFVPNFGAFKGKRLDSVDRDSLKKYFDGLISAPEKITSLKDPKNREHVQAFLAAAEQVLSTPDEPLFPEDA